MASPQPCADGPCCSWPGAASGVQQTLDEMDFDRGETPAVSRSWDQGGQSSGAAARLVGARAGGGLPAPWSRTSRAGPGTSSAARNFDSRAGCETGALGSATFPSGGAGPGSSAGAPPGDSGRPGGVCGGRGPGVGGRSHAEAVERQGGCAAKGADALTARASPGVRRPVYVWLTWASAQVASLPLGPRDGTPLPHTPWKEVVPSPLLCQCGGRLGSNNSSAVG